MTLLFKSHYMSLGKNHRFCMTWEIHETALQPDHMGEFYTGLGKPPNTNIHIEASVETPLISNSIRQSIINILELS